MKTVPAVEKVLICGSIYATLTLIKKSQQTNQHYTQLDLCNKVFAHCLYSLCIIKFINFDLWVTAETRFVTLYWSTTDTSAVIKFTKPICLQRSAVILYLNMHFVFLLLFTSRKWLYGSERVQRVRLKWKKISSSRCNFKSLMLF